MHRTCQLGLKLEFFGCFRNQQVVCSSHITSSKNPPKSVDFGGFLCVGVVVCCRKTHAATLTGKSAESIGKRRTGSNVGVGLEGSVFIAAEHARVVQLENSFGAVGAVGCIRQGSHVVFAARWPSGRARTITGSPP